jgi:hypothetical protein
MPATVAIDLEKARAYPTGAGNQARFERREGRMDISKPRISASRARMGTR